MDGNVTALLGYLVGIIALILVFMEKNNKFVRFHALQSVFWSLIWSVLFIVVGIIWGIASFVSVAAQSGALFGTVTLLFVLLFLVMTLVLIGGLVFAAIKAYGGNNFKLPLVGSLAEKYA